MKQSNPSNKHGIIDEITTDGYFDRARTRAHRRKSPWNLILIPLVLLGWITTSVVLFNTMWHIHTLIYPEHSGKISEYWQKGIHFRAFISSFLLSMPLLFAGIPIGMLLANLAARCIPAIHRVFEQEACGYRHASFRDSTKDLLRAAAFIVPICLFLSLIGALTLKDLK